MPHLRLRGLEKSLVADLSQNLIPELAQLTQAPLDHFTVEHITSSFFGGGKETTPDPFCEVLWFDRGQALQDQVAQIITTRLKQLTPAKDCVVVFTLLAKTAYYENGKHYGR